MIAKNIGEVLSNYLSMLVVKLSRFTPVESFRYAPRLMLRIGL